MWGILSNSNLVIAPLYETIINALMDIDKKINTGYNKLLNNTVILRKWIFSHYKECDPNNPKPNKPKVSGNGSSVTPYIDPSGYVYEAVPSNRVEGVKAEAYYYDYAIDEFGMPADEKSEILWNAEEYDQVNPLYTDAGGRYAWDVPMGQWLVRFSKDGYYDADSRGLPENDADG